MSDKPIIDTEFVAGVNVVTIEDLRISRGLTRRPFSACRHKQLVYDESERRIWCKDCETEVESFDAFTSLVKRSHAHQENLRCRAKMVKEAESFQLRSRAAKVMDKAWRSRSMVPACPHCQRGIFPQDVVNGVSEIGKDFAARLNSEK